MGLNCLGNVSFEAPFPKQSELARCQESQIKQPPIGLSKHNKISKTWLSWYHDIVFAVYNKK